MPKTLTIENISGAPIDRKLLDSPQGKLSLQLASWFSNQGITVGISHTDDGVILMDYALNGTLQPTIRVNSGKLIWPQGTNFDLMMRFLTNA